MENKIKKEIQLFFNDLNDYNNTNIIKIGGDGSFLEDANKLLSKCLEVIKELEEEVVYLNQSIESRDLDIGHLQDELYVAKEEIYDLKGKVEGLVDDIGDIQYDYNIEKDKNYDLETDRDLWRIRANELEEDNKSMCDQIEDLEEDLKDAKSEVEFWKTKYQELLNDTNK